MTFVGHKCLGPGTAHQLVGKCHRERGFLNSGWGEIVVAEITSLEP